MLKIKALFHRLLSVEVRLRMDGNAFDYPLVAGDTGPKIRFNLLDEDGNPVLVSGTGSGVKLFLKQPHRSPHSNSGHEGCSAFDVVSGLWDYSLQPGDVCGAGTYFADVEATYSDGVVETAYEAVRFLVRSSNKD